ncbi:uncharacterized protein LY89DRAFT_788258 [Mollisia scopiformis]|uniref:Uncharacterized protein n=1 Tax=Mollisia scopiformis TaxID=149040 RepID=A0A132BAG1_MOLSC|nr:uncharacterized protein LY89DRAFT_788258 [Mollisia scopiformis]KUJ09388.1 hypothetical protein LY89DRAFT_788258 [Mollisia scopiformis]
MPPPVTFILDPELFNPGFYASILRFWLPTYPKPSSQFTQSDVLRWFGSSSSTDEQVCTLAGRALSSTGPENLILPPFTSFEGDRTLYDEIAAPFIRHLHSSNEDSGTIPNNAHSALALSILLDQFPRNVYRGQAAVYTHYDRLARAAAAKIRSVGLDHAECFAKSPVWRIWLYMNLEHSESVSDHEMFQSALGEMLEISKTEGDEMGSRFVERAMEFEQKIWSR